MRNRAWLAVWGMMMSGAVALAQPAQPTGPLPPMYPPPPNSPYAIPPGYPMALPNIPPPPNSPYAMPNMPSYPNPPSMGYPYAMPPNMPSPMMPNGNPYGQGMPQNMLPNMMPNGNPNGQGMPPNMPYNVPSWTGLPMAPPPDPRLPLGSGPVPNAPSPPKYVGGPQGGATEPYYVQPDSVPPTRGPRFDLDPQPKLGFLQMIADPGASEPYTTYEGPRYPAEARLDNSHVWAQTNFIHWWTRGANAPPLATTGTTGVVGAGDTSVLLGNGSVGPNEFSGIQACLGMWLDPERLQSLEIGGFWLGKVTRNYNVASNANGSPLLATPIIDATNGGANEAALPFASPGLFAGKLLVSSSTEFYGLDFTVARNILRVNGWSVDSLIGFRYLYLRDELGIDQNTTVLPGGANLATFNNIPQPAGANFQINDAFSTTNRFYGGQIGARVNWACGRLDLDAVAKVGLGATSHVINIDGATTLNANGTSTAVAGGTFAQASNIGRYTSTDFSVVPELTLTLGYQISPCFRVLVGYNFIEWNRVERAPNQIDRRIDLTQSPTGGATPGANTTPRFPGDRTDFWAQGINVGFELKF